MAWFESACCPGLPACRMSQTMADMAFQDGLQGGTWPFQKHGFVTGFDPHGSKSRSEGIPWQLFSSRISWRAPNPAMMSEICRNIWGFVSGFCGFSEFSRNDPKWAPPPPVPGTIIWEAGGPWDYYLGVWGPKITLKISSVYRRIPLQGTSWRRIVHTFKCELHGPRN